MQYVRKWKQTDCSIINYSVMTSIILHLQYGLDVAKEISVYCVIYGAINVGVLPL